MTAAAAMSPRALLELLDFAEAEAQSRGVAPGECFYLCAPAVGRVACVRVARRPWRVGSLSRVGVEVTGADGRLLASTFERPALAYLASCEARA